MKKQRVQQPEFDKVRDEELGITGGPPPGLKETHGLKTKTVVAMIITFALTLGAGFTLISLLPGSSPEQDLADDMAEFISTHPRTQENVDQLVATVRNSGCNLLAFEGQTFEYADEAEVFVGNFEKAFGDSTQGYVVSGIYPITWGSLEGKGYYVAVLHADCSNEGTASS